MVFYVVYCVVSSVLCSVCIVVYCSILYGVLCSVPCSVYIVVYRKRGKIRWAKLSLFLRFCRGPRKFFHEYFTQAVIDYIPDQ